MATMTMAWTLQGLYGQIRGTGGVNLATPGGNGVKLMLLTANFDAAVVEFINHASIVEATGTGYPAGGYAVTLTVTPSGATLVTIDGTDISDTGVTLDSTGATHAALYHDTGTPATSRILAKGTLDTPADPDNGPLTVTWNASGILTVGTA